MKFISPGKTNWKFLIILILFTIIIGVISFWPDKNQQSVNEPSVATEGTSTKQNNTIVPKKTQTVAEKSLAYTDALNLYANKRIQFDPNCLATPSYVVFTMGTKIMLDNRSDQTRPIFLDGKKYSLEPYGFKIVTITTSAPLPHTMHVDCGTGKNNAQIIVQQ